MTATSPLRLASLSKSMTAVAVMRLVERRLVERHLVALDRPVAAQLPGFATADPRGAAITVRHLLTHTSGLPDAGIGVGVATGFLEATETRELRIAVQAVAAGEGYLSPRVTGRVLRLACGGPHTRGVRDDERVAGLTARERDVLGLLAQGLSNREIGRELFLAEGTVKAHVAALLDRLGVANRVGAAVAAHRAGLV